MRIRVLYLLPAMLLLNADTTMALSWDDLWLTADQQGKRALESGDNAAATELFEDSGWAGTAAYRSEEFEAAQEQFSKSETASSVYNKGNALAKGGKLDDAINAYKDALELEPDAVDAVENLALLEKLKEQQEQEQDQQQDSDEESDEENQDESEQEQDSDSQDPSDSEQDGEEGEPNDEQSDQENQPPENEQPSEPEDPKESEQDQDQEQPAEPEEPEEQTKEEQEAAAAQAEEASEQDKEEEQAMQQWLRRVPDDPSGLLREKFRYESQQRQEQGGSKRHEVY